MKTTKLLIISLALFAVTACAPTRIGRNYRVDPRATIKVGYDSKRDVAKKMGPPFRKSVDSQGREIFTYVWADGNGAGEKCIVAFNKNGVAYLVEVYP